MHIMYTYMYVILHITVYAECQDLYLYKLQFISIPVAPFTNMV